MALGWYVASMVCGALWWSPGQTRPLRGQIVQFTFPLWRSGTAVFLASGSRCVTPRPFIGRDPAATHCAHTRLYYLYQKMWAARVSFIHCSAFGRVLRGRLLARVQRGGVSAVGEPAWSASGRALALSSLGRTDCCTVYAPLGSSMRLGSNIQTNRIRTFNRAMGSALAGSQNDVHTEGPKLRIILSHASRSMTSYSTWSREYLGERQRTARLYPVWTECFDALRARQATWRRSGCSTWRHSGCSWQWALLQPRMAR